MAFVRGSWILFVMGCLYGSGMTGCGTDDPPSAPRQQVFALKAERLRGDPDAGLAELMGKVFSTGPAGAEPTPAREVLLTDAELQQIRGLQATAVIVMHYGDNDWTDAQVAGLSAQFEVMGIDVLSVTEAGFEPAQQAADIREVISLSPDVMVAFPLARAETFRAAAEAGIRLVFMDMLPAGDPLVHGRDYISVVSADSYGNGVATAHLLAKYLGGRGKIGVIFHRADFFVTHQRYLAFKETVKADYPEMDIVAESGMAGPDYLTDARLAAADMLTAHPFLDGVWTPWDVPAEGVMAAARAAGRTDLAVTTIDLGLRVAEAMARGEMIVGIGAQRPFDQGVTEAILAGYALIGKPAPEYVLLNAYPVTRQNLARGWEIVYHQRPPPALTGDAEKDKATP